MRPCSLLNQICFSLIYVVILIMLFAFPEGSTQCSIEWNFWMRCVNADSSARNQWLYQRIFPVQNIFKRLTRCITCAITSSAQLASSLISKAGLSALRPEREFEDVQAA